MSVLYLFVCCSENSAFVLLFFEIKRFIFQLYKKPLEELTGTADELLNKKEIAIIFSKIPNLIQVHTSIYNSLRAVIRDWNLNSLVGKVWADGSADLKKVYPPYINGYDESLRTLEACDQARPKFHTFLKVFLRGLTEFYC